jgi:CRISPR-associated protein Csm1
MTISNDVLNAALAGLLHDVGKLVQRAQLDPWRTPEGIAQEGQPVHAAWTQYFVEYIIPQRWKSAGLAGAYHHHPEKSPAQDKSLSKLVALADKLSAGERADALEKSAKPPRQLLTIFDRVSLQELSPLKAEHYLPLQPLALQESVIFPKESVDADTEGNAYQTLVDGLEEAAKQDIKDGETYLENLLSAMQRYTWCVPSAYYHAIPDVSLYDHSRMAAALAVCLAERPADEISSLLGAVERDFKREPQAGDDELLMHPVALLVGGDISGIQNFIYTISSKGAAKMLRGRSFYLQLLTEAIMRYVLRELELPYVNVIYSGGGHFYLLAPVSAEVRLKKIQAEISKILFTQHGVDLYLALGSSLVPTSGFRAGEFPKYWQRMHNQLTNAKNRRYAELDQEMYGMVFSVTETGGNPDATCKVCDDDRRSVSQWAELETQDKICTLCRSFAEDLGKKLPQARFLALKLGPPDRNIKLTNTALEILKAFGMEIQFITSENDQIDLQDGQKLTLWALDDVKDHRWPGNGQAAHWLRYTVNRVPPITFDDLQKKAGSGFERLGVLRMDVDNLGDIFSKGLGEQATLARLSTLSFQISLFFEGWLKRIVERSDWQDLIYTVYAGGDDLFLLGPWDRIPTIAQKVAQEFHQYTGGHPDLHISGGMAFIDGKYPVYQAAEDAEDAENLAKSGGKNAFAFLGEVWRWDEFEQLVQKKNRLINLVKGEIKNGQEGPKDILSIFRNLGRMESDAAHERKRPVWGRWMWLGAYLLKRASVRYEKSKPSLAGELEQLRQDFENNRYANIFQWGVAARWAQLETRARKGHE